MSDTGDYEAALAAIGTLIFSRKRADGTTWADDFNTMHTCIQVGACATLSSQGRTDRAPKGQVEDALAPWSVFRSAPPTRTEAAASSAAALRACASYPPLATVRRERRYRCMCIAGRCATCVCLRIGSLGVAWRAKARVRRVQSRATPTLAARFACDASTCMPPLTST